MRHSCICELFYNVRISIVVDYERIKNFSNAWRCENIRLFFELAAIFQT